MFKVLAAAVLLANVLTFSRFWQPGRAKGLYAGLQGAALGALVSCLASLVLTVCFPGPYRLSIYMLALNMLLTPSLATAGVIFGVRRALRPDAVDSPSFAEVMGKVAGTQEAACEEPPPDTIST